MGHTASVVADHAAIGARTDRARRGRGQAASEATQTARWVTPASLLPTRRMASSLSWTLAVRFRRGVASRRSVGLDIDHPRTTRTTRTTRTHSGLAWPRLARSRPTPSHGQARVRAVWRRPYDRVRSRPRAPTGRPPSRCPSWEVQDLRCRARTSRAESMRRSKRRVLRTHAARSRALAMRSLRPIQCTERTVCRLLRRERGDT